MKNLLKFSVAAIIIAAAIIASCNKEEDPVPTNIDKTELQAIYDDALALHDGAVEGINAGQYAAGSKAAFKTVIDAAKTVLDDLYTTEATVAAMETQLSTAMETFLSQRIEPVSTDYLIAQWLFNGDATDASGNGHDGTLKSGHENFYTGGSPVLPVLTTDRFGNADMAYYFNKGANIEVPYSSQLNPDKELSVSVWIKMESQDNNDYIISLDRWIGYKLNLQSEDKLYYTIRKQTDPDTWEFVCDDDSNPFTVKENVWTHVVCSYATAGVIKFFADGVKVREISDRGVIGDLMTVTKNLCIGQQLPTSDYMVEEAGATDGFFKGAMDDMRLYNKALTDSEALSLYTLEHTEAQ
ncbi:MAG: LamG domain-containing protein [Bacteroidota bacterium]